MPKKNFIHPEWPYDAESENAKFITHLYKTFLRRPPTPGRQDTIFVLPYLIAYNVCYLLLISPPGWSSVTSIICYIKQNGLALLIVMRGYLPLDLQKKILHIVWNIAVASRTLMMLSLIVYFFMAMGFGGPRPTAVYNAYGDTIRPESAEETAYYEKLKNKYLFVALPRVVFLIFFLHFFYFVLRGFFALIK
jgi:hypothetical protein